MNLEELRRIREQERSTDSLQDLRPNFYTQVAEYLGDLRDERDEHANDATDPFTDTDVKQLTDELEAAERTVEALYERRVGKIVKLASFAAADMAVEVEGLTTEERDLFDTIVQTIREFDAEINATLEADEPPAVTIDDASRGDDDVESETDAANGEAGNESDSQSEVEEAKVNVDRTTVKITDDIGPIVGIDERDYHLECDDIVTLPTENAEPLIDGNVAEPLE